MTNPIQDIDAAFEAREAEVQSQVPTADEIWEAQEQEQADQVKQELDQNAHPENYEAEPVPESLSEPERISKLLEEE